MQEADTLFELAQEDQQRGEGACSPGSSGSRRWGREAAASCIYESIPSHCCTPQLRSCHTAYAAHRSRWPLRAAVADIIFRSQLTQLVCGLLGSQALLFNDQASSCTHMPVPAAAAVDVPVTAPCTAAAHVS